MHEVRKTVTVLFADVVASTELGDRLDPESLRELQSRYFAEMSRVVERHGGTVEKFIGDEVMAVFGVPVLHEDDALRAVRAASAMQERLAELNEELETRWGARLDIRIGINTGEVVAGDHTTGHGFVTGSAVNLAKRIEQAAEPGEILMGDPTYRLVRHAVETTHVGPLSLKGKRDDVEPQRLDEVDLSAGAFAHRPDAPIVGRQVEVGRLETAYARALETRKPQLVTVLGPAGIGKSRLARELLERVRDEAVALVGRCVPYGEGVTFWPLRELVDARSLEGSTGEIFWRIRRHLEEQSRGRPLVLCFDDVHWGEPTFLDLVQYLAGWIREMPVLIVCLARPELLERRPDWTHAGGEDATVLTLAPLAPEQVAELLEALDAPADLRARIADAAEGNPLFLEQMAALAPEEGADVAVPASVRSLIAARLDRLDRDEATVVERAAVVGREFPLDAVLDLVPGPLRERTPGLLLGLVRKELVRPHTAGDADGFRFRHALIRDVAYDGLPKQLAADLHERHAQWLDGDGADDVLVGYHLEQTVELRRQLGHRDDATDRLAGRAAALLHEAGKQAHARGDAPAAASLFRRSVSLPAEGDAVRPGMLVDLAESLMRLGQFARVQELLDDVDEAAERPGDRRALLRAAVLRRELRLFVHSDPTAGKPQPSDEEILVGLEQLGDDVGLAKAWRALSDTHAYACRWQARADALEHALALARRDPSAHHEANAIAALLVQALHFGPTPAETVIARCRELLVAPGSDLPLQAGINATLGAALATQGEFEAARTAYAESARVHDELGLRLRRAAGALLGAEIELLADDPAAAEAELRSAYEMLEAMGETGVRAVVAAVLADTLSALGRDDEAGSFAGVAAEIADTSDVAAQALQRSTRARLTARRGDLKEAEALGRDAAALAEGTDFVWLRTTVAEALAEVLATAGRADEARSQLELAARLQREKGNVVAARRLARGLARPTAPA